MPELFGVRVFTTASTVGRKRKRAPRVGAPNKALREENARLKRQLAAARALDAELRSVLAVMQPISLGMMFMTTRTARERLIAAAVHFEETAHAKR